ncbi:tetratricopeptide repeat protein [Nonlabens sp. Asnod3-A02]|uniref:type IX secretion system periplasmic lipoprotein PorW/SprE n=1 Tax=Nonlabens sp. Asnod3-A02 TaxID=3160579 RepID=UPI003864CE16
MKQFFYNICIAFLLIAIITGCSRKNNSFISRNLHAVGTEYNVLYNGNLALQAGLDGLEQTYKDNYWDILPVERMTLKDQVFLPGEKPADPNFERAEEKAVKAVQKHSMLINETEYNPQVDEAYMLLGKARYYDQRFIPALEAFNYILQFMPESDQINQAKVWRERTHMRLDNNEIAIKNLSKLLKEEKGDIEQEDLAIANATLSQAFLNIEQVDSALLYMNRAERQTKNRETQARYKFITAQLFAKQGQRDSAFAHYDEIIDMHRKIPRRYYINAYIEKIKNFDDSQDSKVELLETITDLEENRENRPWLDAIYSRKAIYYENEDSIEGAKEYYNKSLRARNGQDRYLRGNNYSALGKISFDEAKFVNAGKYYDSAVANYVERTKEHRLVTKKRNNLEDVIFYEGRRRSADSIFKVLAMTPQEQAVYYQEYIDDLKAEEERIAQAAEVEAAKEAQNQNAFQTIKGVTKRSKTGPSFSTPGSSIGTLKNTGSSFYFYNQQTVARGKVDFRRKWGKRDLKDNWRRKNKKEELETEVIDEQITEVEEVRPEFKTEFYTSTLPEGKIMLDSIAQSRNFAYYQLGVIYKEKFKRNDLAINRFDTLLTHDPEEKLLLPALYNLYLIYKEDGGSNAFAKAEQLKNKIISNYPDTRYAQILRNPEAKLDDSASPLAVYNRLYKEYEKENYEVVISSAENYANRFSGDDIVPRLELLKAFAAGRLYGFEEYKKGLDYVALNFPNTEVGKSAQKLASDAETIKIAEAFQPENNLKDFKLVYRFNTTDAIAMENLKNKLLEVFKNENYNFRVSVDVYNKDEKLVVVHGLNSKLGARGLGDLMAKPENNYNITKSFFAIASENYKIIQVYKNLDKYQKEML